MQPLGPEIREAILEANPEATPEEIDEYERLLTERANSDPDNPDPIREARLQELENMLFPREEDT